MNKVLIVLSVMVFMLLSISPVFSADFAELQVVSVEGRVTPQLNVWFDGTLNRSEFGWFLWSLNKEDYAEAYAGFSWTPAPWIQVGLGYGAEYNDGPIVGRFGSFVWVGKGKFSLIGFYEDLGSGPWHKVVGTYAVTDRFKLGVLDQTFKGTGPYAEWKVNPNWKLWASYVTGDGDDKTLVGLRYSL